MFSKKNKPFNVTKTKLGYAMDSVFVSTVVNSCFVLDKYTPSNFEPMFLLNLAQFFTDFKLITVKDDDGIENIDIDASLVCLEDNNLLDVLYGKCGEDYIESLRSNALDLLEFEKAKRATPIADLISKVNNILDNLSKVTDLKNNKEFMNVIHKFSCMDDGKVLDKIVQFAKEKEKNKAAGDNT